MIDQSVPVEAEPVALRGSTYLILLSVLCTALIYLAVGMPLAVLPGWVHHRLGYGVAVAGAAVSLQYAATIASRALVGPMADAVGPRRPILLGFCCCAASGVFLLAASLLQGQPFAALSILALSRLSLGFGESLIGTSAITWAIARSGAKQATRVISWNGVATYGGLAAGTPAGVWLAGVWSIGAVGGALLAIGLIGFAFTLMQTATASVQAARQPFSRIMAVVLPYGTILGLGAIGFGVIASFVALFFKNQGWGGAWMALSGFGLAFVSARLVFVGMIGRHGGARVAIVFFAIEIVGLVTLWRAPTSIVAIIGSAMAGFGFSLIFPALGVLVVDLVPPQNRGTAIGAYSMFIDIALLITGPAAGFLAARGGYGAPFLFGAAASLVALLLLLKRCLEGKQI